MSSNLIVTVTDNNFQSEVMESKVPVLVDFWAPWCGPCIALGPILEKVAAAREGKIKICKVNVEENPNLAAKFNIRNIPFMALIKDGEKVADMVGNQPEKKILEAVDKLDTSSVNNKTDENKSDENKSDENKSDENKSDENKSDENKSDKNKSEE